MNEVDTTKSTEQARRTRRRRRIAGLVALGVTCALGARLLSDTVGIRVNVYRIPPPVDAPPLPRMRIGLIVDTHTGGLFNGLGRLERIVARTNALDLDLVLLAGDYVYHGTGMRGRPTPAQIAGVLGGLRARHGVYAVLGNHDWWDDEVEIAQALVGAGIPVIDDQLVRLDLPGGSFELVGISDEVEGPCRTTETLRGATPGSPLLVLTHNPDLFPELPTSIGLAVAGHTHGGQIRLPFFGSPFVPSRFGERFLGGLYVERGMPLFVSRGLGTSILPIRFGVPSEIAVLEVGGE